MVFLILSMSGAEANQGGAAAPVEDNIFDDRCTVQVLTQTVTMNSNGTINVPNVPAANVLVRARVICEREDLPRYGESEFFVVVGGQTYSVGFIVITQNSPLAVVSLSATPDTLTLTSIGQSTQIRVSAVLSDGSIGDITPRAQGSTYVTTNPAIATVDQEGLVTATGQGFAFITVTNQGAAAITGVAAPPSSL